MSNVRNNNLNSEFLKMMFKYKFLEVDCYVFKNIECINVERLTDVLTYYEYLEKYRNYGFFHYFVPTKIYNQNHLFVAFEGEIPEDIIDEFKPEKIISNPYEVLKIGSETVNGSKMGFENHSFVGTNDSIAEDFLRIFSSDLETKIYSGKAFEPLKDNDKGGVMPLSIYQKHYIMAKKIEDTIETRLYFIDNYYSDEIQKLLNRY